MIWATNNCNDEDKFFMSSSSTRSEGMWRMKVLAWLKIVLLFLIISQPLYADIAQPTPESCEKNCNTQYGVELGISPSGIPAYSNCSSECVIFEANRFKDVYTGIKWQCVEYARRWLLTKQGVVFGDVVIAAQIWGLDKVTNPINGDVHQFDAMVNGTTKQPQPGDLLIYGKEYLGTGHVAVIVEINEKRQTLQIAEQNYFNINWDERFAREISYIIKDDQYWVLDKYLIGWKRVLNSGNTH